MVDSGYPSFFKKPFAGAPSFEPQQRAPVNYMKQGKQALLWFNEIENNPPGSNFYTKSLDGKDLDISLKGTEDI